MKSEDKSIKEILLSVKTFFALLLPKWKTILLLGLIGGLVGFFYGHYQKPLYTASLRFAMEDDNSTGGAGLSGALGLASSLGFDLGGKAGGVFNGANLIELLKSRSMVEKTLLTKVEINNKTISLIDYYLEVNGSKSKWSSQLQKELSFQDTSRQFFSRKKDSLMGLVYGALTAKSLVIGQKDKKTTIIDISLESRDEFFSKKFVETLVDVVTSFYVITRTKKSSNNIEILQRQTDSVRQELNNAIVGVASSIDNIFNLNASLNIKRTPSQKRQVDVQANTAILTELVKNLELAKVTLRKETPFIHIIDKPIMPLKKEKVSKIFCAVLSGFLFSLIYIFVILSKLFWTKISNE